MGRIDINFIERADCPCCGISGKRLISLPYDDWRVSSFIATYYGNRVPVEALHNVCYQIDRCDTCGLLWQRWILDEKGLQLLYEQWISPEESLAKKSLADISLFSRYSREMEAVAECCGKRSQSVAVLDFGMGWGYWCQMARAFGFQVYGYDFSIERRNHAGAMGIRVIGTIDQLQPFRFHFINCEQVVEHLANPRKTLKLLANCLADNGVIRIAVPDGAMVAADLMDPDWRAGKDALQPLEHINCFSHDALCFLAEKAGLQWMTDCEIVTPNQGTCLYFRKRKKTSINYHPLSFALRRSVSSSIAQISCIIRSVKERTTTACTQLLTQEYGKLTGDAIMMVGGKPFPETLADSFQAGIEARRPWTLCVDADVLPLPGAVAGLVKRFESMSENTFAVQGLVFDRLFGGWRPAGVHLYRTELLPRALYFLDQVQKDVRPESSLIERMAKEGYPWSQTGMALGLHDFEQAPQDLARKSFLHAWKHVHLISRLLTYWRMRREESDFTAALQGLAAGVAFFGDFELDWRQPYFPQLSPTDPLARIDSAMVLYLLEKEQSRIRELGFRRAPVWDWAEEEYCQPAWLNMLWHALATIVERRIRTLVVEGDNPVVAETIGREAMAWGVNVLYAGPWWCASVPSFGTPLLAIAPDSSLALHCKGERGEILAVRTASSAPVSYEQTAIILVSRLVHAGVDNCLVYGAGEIAAAVYRQAIKAGLHILAFLVSEPKDGEAFLFDGKICAFDQGISEHACRDIVIASIGSAKAMVRRVIMADQNQRLRIWCFH